MKKKSKSQKKSKRVKKLTTSEKYLSVDPFENFEIPIFCTECEHDLDTFWLSERACNSEAVRKNHQRCREIGKFKGELCAKMFIINDNDVEDIWLRED